MTASTIVPTTASPNLPHVSPLRTYWEIVLRSFWVTFIFVGLSTSLIEQTGSGLPLTSLALIALGCTIYSLFASAPFGVAAWVGTLGTSEVQRTFPRLQRGLEFVAILFFVIAIFSPAQFGPLDGAELNRVYSFAHYIGDWSRFVGMSAIVLLLFWYALRKKFPLFRWVCVLAVAFAVYACVSKDIFGTSVERAARQTVLRKMTLENLGSEKNIIVIVVDSLQGGIAEIAMREEALRREYDDFTFFRLGVSPTSATDYAVPVLLSGQNTPRHSKDCRIEDTFFHDAHEAGYENRLFLFPRIFYETYPHCVSFEPYQIPMLPLNEIGVFPSSLMANLYYFVDHVTKNVYLGASKTLPIVASRWIIKKGDNAVCRIFGMRSTTPERFSEREFVRSFKTWRVGSEKKELLFYHHSLFHVPLQFDRQGNISFFRHQYAGDYVVGSAGYNLEMLAPLFRSLKAKQLWDESLIILVADHGFRFGYMKDDGFAAYPELPKKLHSGADPSSYHPMFLIKFPHQQHPLELSNIPIALSDIRGLIDQYVHTDDWENVKPSVFEIPLDRENEIHHGQRITFRGGADAIPAAIENYERNLRAK